MSDPSGYYGYAISLGSTFLLGAEAVLAFVSAPVVLIGVGIIGVGLLAYEGYQYYKSETTSNGDGSSDTPVISSSEGTGSTGGGSNAPPPKKPRKPTDGHHPYLKALGGAAAQKVIQVAPELHRKVHSALYNFENGWLAPKRGYNGELIQRLYGAKKN